MKKLILLCLLITGISFAQTTHVFPALDTNNVFTGRMDMSGASSTAPVKAGTLAARPNTCNALIDMYLTTDTQALYECNGSGTGWFTINGASNTGLLTDWTNASVSNGQCPVWNSTTGKWTPGACSGSGATNTSGLTDWTNVGLTNGQCPVYNSSSGKWTPGSCGSGGGNVSNSGSPTTNQEAVWTDSTHVKGQDKAEIDIRSWGVDCTGNTDNASILNTQFASIAGKHVKWPNNCIIRIDSAVTITGQENFWLDGPANQSIVTTSQSGIAGCNGAPGFLLTVQRSGFWRISGLGFYPKHLVGVCATSAFTGSIDIRNDGGGGFTTTNIELDHLSITSNLQGSSIANYKGIALEGGPNMEQFRLHDSWIHCQGSSNSSGVYLNGANADNGEIKNNALSSCKWGVNATAWQGVIAGNQTGDLGTYSTFGAGGGFVLASFQPGERPLIIKDNEISDGGPFIANVGTQIGSLTIENNKIGTLSINPSEYVMNLMGTKFVVKNNSIWATQSGTCVLAIGDPNELAGVGGLGQLMEENNTFLNDGASCPQPPPMTPYLAGTQPPYQYGESHFGRNQVGAAHTAGGFKFEFVPSGVFSGSLPTGMFKIGGSAKTGSPGLTTQYWSSAVGNDDSLHGWNSVCTDNACTIGRANTALSGQYIYTRVSTSNANALSQLAVVDTSGSAHLIWQGQMDSSGNPSIKLSPLFTVLKFSNAGSGTGDVGLSRTSSGVLALGNGTQGNANGTLNTDIVNANTAFKYNGGAGTAGQYLKSDAVNGFIPGTISATDISTSLGSANFSSTSNSSGTLYAVPSAQEGLYVVWYTLQTTAIGAAGTAALTITWNNGAALSTSSANLDLTTLNAELGGSVAVHSLASQNITYAVTITGGSGSPQYSLRASVERKL